MSTYVVCDCGWRSRPLRSYEARNAARLHERRHTLAARTHVQSLVADGCTMAGIGRAVGVSRETIRKLLWGVTRYLNQQTAAAILLLEPSASLRHPAYRPPVTRRCPTCNAEFTVPGRSKRSYCKPGCTPANVTILHTPESGLPALRAAAEAHGGRLTHVQYTAWRETHGGPSRQWFALAFDGWNNALIAAGIPNGGPSRHYVNFISADDCWTWVRKAWAEGVRTYDQYETWQREHDGAPCGSIVRRRIGGWQETRLQLMAEAS